MHTHGSKPTKPLLNNRSYYIFFFQEREARRTSSSFLIPFFPFDHIWHGALYWTRSASSFFPFVFCLLHGIPNLEHTYICICTCTCIVNVQFLAQSFGRIKWFCQRLITYIWRRPWYRSRSRSKNHMYRYTYVAKDLNINPVQVISSLDF